ncbi:DNA-directed RNA polymerase subunit K [Candidatus Woesearchaeota archaeon]|nr:DNA-directed RNA polymerase subunit K [Candidatus Woesearchaeota archaeon]
MNLAAKKEETDYTKYETARIIGSRALQLSMGAPMAIKLSKKQLEEIRYNPVEIAKLEMEEGKVPIGVKRPMPKSKALKEEK